MLSLCCDALRERGDSRNHGSISVTTLRLFRPGANLLLEL
jgi:hypothetical protein